jgi:hypothetical protein
MILNISAYLPEEQNKRADAAAAWSKINQAHDVRQLRESFHGVFSNVRGIIEHKPTSCRTLLRV